MVMKNNVFMIFICINLLLLSAAGFVVAGLYHDINILRYYNESLRQSILGVQQKQEEQAKEMRIIKTNNEIVYDLVINKEWEK